MNHFTHHKNRIRFPSHHSTTGRNVEGEGFRAIGTLFPSDTGLALIYK